MENLFAIASDDVPLTCGGTILATRWPHIVYSSSLMQSSISFLSRLHHHRASLVTNFFNNVDSYHLSSQPLTHSTLDFLFNGSGEQHNFVLIGWQRWAAWHCPHLHCRCIGSSLPRGSMSSCRTDRCHHTLSWHPPTLFVLYQYFVLIKISVTLYFYSTGSNNRNTWL